MLVLNFKPSEADRQELITCTECKGSMGYLHKSDLHEIALKELIKGAVSALLFPNLEEKILGFKATSYIIKNEFQTYYLFSLP